MVKRKTLMESLSSNLHSFPEKTNKNLSVPDKKFLRADHRISASPCQY
jgi:hypothetical protein